MNIALYSPAEDARFGFRLREQRGMGGSEAHAQMRMREWARRGHNCVIYSAWPEEQRRIEDGVLFATLSDGTYEAGPWDLVILQRRTPEDHELLKRSAAFKVFSNNDNMHAATTTTQEWQEYVFPFVDKVMTYSWWHRNQAVKNHGAPPEKTTCIPHPLEPSEFPSPWSAKVERRFIYCSLPNRGLAWLMEMWPDIAARLPGSTLRVAGDYTIRDGPRHADQLRSKYGWFFDRRDVEFEGALGMKRLREEQAKAEVLLYPTHARETFCASVLECQASGTVPVTTRLGGLPEVVVEGITGLLLGDEWIGDNQEWKAQHKEAYVEAVVALCEDRERLRRMAEAGRARALQDYDVARICDRWEAMVR